MSLLARVGDLRMPDGPTYASYLRGCVIVNADALPDMFIYCGD